MKKNRLLLLSILLIPVAVGLSLVSGKPASAVSAYDDLIQTTSDLTMHQSTSTCNVDLSDTKHYWAELMTTVPASDGYAEIGTGENTWGVEVRPNSQDGWSEKTFWAVTRAQYSSDFGGNSQLSIQYTNDPNATVSFVDDNGSYALKWNISEGYWVRSTLVNISSTSWHDQTCILQTVKGWNSGTGNIVHSPTSTISFSVLFVYASQIVYPDGYAGVVPPETHTPPTYSDWTPDFYVSVATDWRAQIHDTHFNTFDDSPFTCSEGLAPVLHYELWDKTDGETLLTSGTQSATFPIIYQFAKNENISQSFRVVGWYDCGSSPEMQFNKSSFKDFTIKKDGSLFTVGFETCLKDEFPFVDLNSCRAGINDSLALLTFQGLNANNPSIDSVSNANPDSCYHLQKLGNWIHKPNASVCPAFSPDVRNTITPFVIFIVASTVFLFLTRLKGADS